LHALERTGDADRPETSGRSAFFRLGLGAQRPMFAGEDAVCSFTNCAWLFST